MNGLGEGRVGCNGTGGGSTGLGLKGVGVMELGRNGWGVNEWAGRRQGEMERVGFYGVGVQWGWG